MSLYIVLGTRWNRSYELNGADSAKYRPIPDATNCIVSTLLIIKFYEKAVGHIFFAVCAYWLAVICQF
jgi:hypothetical protein